MMNHVWGAYKKYAWGDDILLPIAKRGKQWWKNQKSGLTIIDSLDTLWLMGMREEFNEGVEYVIEHVHFDVVRFYGYISPFLSFLLFFSFFFFFLFLFFNFWIRI